MCLRILKRIFKNSVIGNSLVVQFNSWVMKILWRRDRLPTPVFLGFPWGSAGKESACNVGDLGSISGLGRPPEEGKGYPLQHAGLENSMDCTVHGIAKSRAWLSNFHFTSLINWKTTVRTQTPDSLPDTVCVLSHVCETLWQMLRVVESAAKIRSCLGLEPALLHVSCGPRLAMSSLPASISFPDKWGR